MEQMGEAPLGRARLCLAVGDVAGAVAALEDAVARIPDFAEAHRLLGGLYVGSLDDYPRARHHFEIALHLHRESGDLVTAVRCAVMLSMVEAAEGDEPGRAGWLACARRLLDEVGPCVEEGYYRVARRGFEVPDVAELEANAAAALDLARRFGDGDLEIRALAERSLALVSMGRTAEGLTLLESATASVLAGEVRAFGTCGMACCALVTTCYRLGDLRRLTRLVDGLRRMATEHFHGLQQPILTAHCRETVGGVLADAGRWEEAEVELQRAIAASACVGHRAAAAARLALLRVHQGRVAEAAELLRGYEDRLEVAAALAQIQDARHELDLAASTLRQALGEQTSNPVLSAPLLGHLVDVECRRGDVEAAGRAAARLESIAALLASPEVASMALLGRGRVCRARGEDAGPSLQAALRGLEGLERPQLRADVHLALAGAGSFEPAAEVAEARTALALFTRLGARREIARAAGVLRSLGDPATAADGC
jgi:tetratricopeptide (TPR) repeat protein